MCSFFYPRCGTDGPALAEVKDSSRRTNWMAARYDPDDSGRLVLLAKGDGGFPQLMECLDDAIVVFACLIFRAGGQLKVCFINWVGSDVGGLERARVSMHKNDVLHFCEPVVSLDLYERAEPREMGRSLWVWEAGGRSPTLHRPDNSRLQLQTTRGLHGGRLPRGTAGASVGAAARNRSSHTKRRPRPQCPP